MSALTWAGVALLGALGSLARFRVGAAVSARYAGDFPHGTLAVNLTGAFALGLLVGAGVPHRPLFVLGTGFLGGYTTFSTWMVESERLGEAGELPSVAANLGASMLLGLAGAALGWLAGRALA